MKPFTRMKWVSSLILAIMLMLMPLQAAAQSPERLGGTYKWTSPFVKDHKQPLSSDEQGTFRSQGTQVASNDGEFIDLLAQNIANYNTSFSIQYSQKKLDMATIKDLLIQALQKNEYVDYMITEISYDGYYYPNSGSTINFTFHYYETKAQEAVVDQKVGDIISSIIKPQMTEHEKVKAIHDYLVLHIRYDESLTYNSPYYALTEETTACNGYAMLAYKMLEKVGLDARLISGTVGGVGHAWNLVNIDGNWYHLDATWDDPIPDQPGDVQYDYYLLTDSEIRNDHSFVNGGLNGQEMPYPASNTSYDRALQAMIQKADEKEQQRLRQYAEDTNVIYMFPEYKVDGLSNLKNKLNEKFDEGESTIILRYVNSKNDLTRDDQLKRVVEEVANKRDDLAWIDSYYLVHYVRGDKNNELVVLTGIEYDHPENVPVQKLVQVPEKIEFTKIGAKKDLNVKVYPNYATKKGVIYKSSNENVVTVDQKGQVTSIGDGQATIIVTSEDGAASASIPVTVNAKVKNKIEEYPIPGYKSYRTFKEQQSDKTWKITFTTRIKASSVQDSSVYVLNAQGERMDAKVTLSNDQKSITITPPEGNYQSGETYYIVVEGLQSLKGKPLKNPYTIQFTIK